MVLFSIVALFPFNKMLYFITILGFVNITTYFIYSFPHSTKIRLPWALYFATVSTTLLTLFIVINDFYLPALYLSIIPLFWFPQIYFIIKKRGYLEKHLKVQTTLFLSLLTLLPLLQIIGNSIALLTYNISMPKINLFVLPVAGIIMIFVGRRKTIFLSTGLNLANLSIAAGIVIPFTFLTILMRPLGLYFHTILPLSHIAPITAITGYFMLNIIAVIATISTLVIEKALYGKEKKFAKIAHNMQSEIEKTTTIIELHRMLSTTLFRTFPSITQVHFFLLSKSNADDDFSSPDRLDLEALSAEKLCRKESLFALKNSPNINPTLNKILQTQKADALFPFRKYGSLCGFYLIESPSLNETDWTFISSLLITVASRHGHIILFNQLINQEKKLQDRRYLYETGKMISVIAHELRTPLASIMFNLDVTLEEIEKEQIPDGEYLDISRKELRRLNDTVEKMLTYGRVTKLESTKGTFEEFTTEITTMLHFPDTDITIKPMCQLTEYTIDWDRLKTIIINLLTNSYQALKECDEKKINITIQEVDAFIHIHIIDNGPGIEHAKQQQIFSPFFSTKKEGNGLGLAICEKITKLMGGGIQLHSSKRGHTDFHIWIQTNQEMINGG